MSEKALRTSASGLQVGYLAVLPRLVREAREHGYALAVHGSLARDLDLVAAPWVEEAAAPDVLADALVGAVGGFYESADFPARKPHGRLSWAIHLGGGPYIDLSVLPPVGETMTRAEYDAARTALVSAERERDGLRQAMEALAAGVTQARRLLTAADNAGPLPDRAWHLICEADGALDVAAGRAAALTQHAPQSAEVTGERPPAPERHPLSQERSYASASPSDLPPAWRHDVWLSRVVSALHRAGFGDRVPDCQVVDEDAILAALDDLVAAARSRS